MAGRPKGSRNRATKLAEALLEGQAKSPYRWRSTVMAPCSKLTIERLISRRTERALTFALPSISKPEHASAALGAVIKAAAAGELTLTESGQFAALIETALRAIETTEHEARITVLEKNR